MPGRGRRIIAGIGWVIASLVVWAIVCNVVGFSLMYLVNERQVSVPAWTTDAYNWIAVGGVVLIPPVVAVLAMRGKLPGTGVRRSRGRGFPLDAPA
jgi:hypothetical protein